jgi:hypothetical protein
MDVGVSAYEKFGYKSICLFRIPNAGGRFSAEGIGTGFKELYNFLMF